MTPTEHDIFISYAHIDDEPLIDGQPGWVSNFHRALEIRLAQVMGRKVKIWRDPKLKGNQLFDREIVEQFPNVAVLITILSPRYVKSEWCIRELNEFDKSCKEDQFSSVNNDTRIFKVIKTPVSVEQQPEILKKLLGYEFYQTDRGSGRFIEYTLEIQQLERHYWERLNDIVNDVSKFLENLELAKNSARENLKLEQQDEDRSQPLTGNKKIFIAESTADCREFREIIKREFQDRGFIILPDKPLPLEAPKLTKVVEDYVAEAALSVHLLGETYGVVPEGSYKSVVELQSEICSASKTPQLVWIPEFSNLSDDRQKAFISAIENNVFQNLDADIIKSSIEEFKFVIADKLEMLRKIEEKVSSEKVITQNAASKFVYLICDVEDANQTASLENFLFDNGFEVVTPVFEGNESLIREDHLENLKICSAAIIFFGNAKELWLRSKMRDFLKIKGYGRTTPLNIKAVYLAEPASTDKKKFRTLEAQVIDGTEGLPEYKLRNVLSKII